MLRQIQRPYVIGMDIGSTITRFAIVNARGHIIESDMVNTRDYATVYDFVPAICEKLSVMIEKVGGSDKIKAMGIGAPNANYYRNIIDRAMNLPWHDELPLAALLQDQLGITVGLTNDANATAVGEMYYGGARGLRNFVEITLGRGVGCGLVINGQLVYGADGNAGEFGHICVRPEGRQCGCGLIGCVEAYCSASGVVNTARQLLMESDKESLLSSVDINAMTSYDLYDAALKNDPIAIEAFKEMGRVMGEGFAHLVNLLSPEAIILQGGMVKTSNFWIDIAQETMLEHVLPVFRENISLSVSELNNKDAALLGAAAFAWELKEYKLFI
ncbi:MAG: ROK family protein [Bacteroidaceae bacterium]|nr:ROK family protein [Bacteroidaceae bacterium]